MAFDQNLIPKDLRPLSTAKINAEEARISPVTTSGRSPDGFYPNPPRSDISSPPAVSVYFIPSTSDAAGFGGLGFANTGLNLNPAAAPPMWAPRILAPVGVTTGINSSSYVYNPNIGVRGGENAADQASDDGGEDSVSGKKVKFLCSFGGKILPRPSDRKLRYVGGQTRIISVRRGVSFNELVQKMADTYGQPVIVKYQLPDEDLDALVSVSCPDDLENMMDEYEKLLERSPDGSTKLRVFLFSASEVDSSSGMEFGDPHDSGQRYVDAVNGIIEGVGGGITRKESIASAASTQNSDVSGTDALETSLIGQDVTGPPSSSILSPKSDYATSSDNASRHAYVDATTAFHAESPIAPLGAPVAKSIPQIISSQPEMELERTMPGSEQQQLGGDLQQAGVKFPPSPSAYVQGYVDLHQDAVHHADYQKLPPQVVYANPQVVAAARPVLIQAQYPDKAPTFVPQQFIPAVPISMTPSSSHLSINPNMVQQLMQSQGLVTIPADQSYKQYPPPQVTPTAVGGGYGWHQVLPQEHVAFSEGWMPHPQVILPEKIPKMADCYMCQKQLPHAHSDTVVPEQRDGSSSNISNTNPIYHSLHLDNTKRVHPETQVVVSGPLVDGILEPQQQAAGKGPVEVAGVSQNLDAQHDIDRFASSRVDDPDHAWMLASQGVVGLGGDVQTPYEIVGVPHSCFDDAIQQHLVPPVSHVKQEFRVTKPVNGDTAAFGCLPFQTPEVLAHDTAKDYLGNISGAILREDAIGSGISHEHAVDNVMEHLHVKPPEIPSSTELNKSPVDLAKKDVFDHISQQIFGREALAKDALSMPLIPESNQAKTTEVLPYSTPEVSHWHDVQPAESYEAIQAPLLSVPVSKLQSKLVVHHIDGNPAFFGSNSAYAADRVSPINDLRGDAGRLQPMVASNDLENLSANTILQSSVTHSNWSGNIHESANSLFSNQDPWNFRHDSHFPPPRPGKIATRREASVARDPYLENHSGNSAEPNGEPQFVDALNLPVGNLNRDHSSNQVQDMKVSSEELIKQELQATAEGVASSVLQSSVPSNPDSSLCDRNAPFSDSSNERELQSNSEAAIQAKLEGVNIKTEKTNFGFPLSGGIGRLQIIKNCDLEELRELGSGTFGTVYHGKWRGTDVAIKRINDRCFVGKPSEQERMRDDFWNEAIKLADLHHPNVVAFYGVVLDGPGGSVATVTEYMVNGSLRNALQKSERNLDKRKRLLIAMDVAFGMEYLHSKNIVHFDLKSDNLLVNLRDPHRPICKVGDLGLSKVKCQTLISGGVRGTLPWMAPELLNGGSSLVSEKVDVFSFGIVMWELQTGEEPYADLHYGAIIGGIVSNTLRPPVPENCDPDWRSLMERCWSAEPSERPSFTEIANELRTMAAKLPPKVQTPATNTKTNA
ncbi:hypothetical protein Ancab_035107 [Ancistrocladus abbreviatus]